MYDRILAINKNKTLSFELEQLSFTGYHFKKKQTRMITITWLLSNVGREKNKRSKMKFVIR